MNRIVKLGLLGVGLALPVAAQGKTINFHDANQGYRFYGGYNVLMYGQGAAADPGNNVWNGFGNYGGPGSTYFYGSSNPDSAHGSVPSNNPGNPYAYYGNGTSGNSSGGSGLFSPSTAGTPAANAYSDGTVSPVTLNLTFGGETGVSALGNGPTVQTQGSPNKILSESVLVSGSNLGTFTLGSVPAGTYNLYLYGANYDGDRGATFAITNGGGTALGGITTTMNPGGGPLNSFVLGQDYVEFLNVTPDSFGTIAGTFGAVSNLTTGQSGEGDFNGLQLVSVVPEPTSIAIFAMASVGLLGRRRRSK